VQNHPSCCENYTTHYGAQRTRTRKHLQMCLEPIRGTLVGQNHVGESVRKRPTADIGMDGQRLGRGLDLWVGTQSVEGRNMSSNTGVWRQLSPQCGSSGGVPVFAAASAKHVAEKTPALLVVLGLFVKRRGSRDRFCRLLNRNRPLRRQSKGRNRGPRPTYRRDAGDAGR
jgi:hypothetical protein